MKSKCLIVTFLWLGLTIPAVAQDTREEPEKIQNIRRLLKMVGMEKIQQSMMDQILGAMKNAMPPATNPDEQKMADRFAAILSEEFKKIGFTNIAVELYDKYFNAAEIKALIQFYESTIGQKAIQVLPSLTQESTSRGMEMGNAAATKAVERWFDEFPELKKFTPPLRN